MNLPDDHLLNLIGRFSASGEAEIRRFFGDFDTQEGISLLHNADYRLQYHCCNAKPTFSISIPGAPLNTQGNSKMLAPLEQLDCCRYMWVGLYLNCCALLAGMTARSGPTLRVILRGPGSRLRNQTFKFAPELAQKLLDTQKARYQTRAQYEKGIMKVRAPDATQQSLF